MVDMVVVVPEPPLMIPQLTVGGAPESAVLRAACLDAAARLGAVAQRWIVVAADPKGRRTLVDPGGGTFLGYGVDIRVALAPGARHNVRADLPLPLLIAGWLRDRAAPGVTAHAELVAPGLPTEECRRVGAELAASAGRQPGPLGLLVVGDGTTAHADKATGHPDRRAGPFDAAVAAALASADPAALLGLDAELATELNAVGRAPWQVLAAEALTLGGRWRGELAYSAAPYGVAYHVALWHRDR